VEGCNKIFYTKKWLQRNTAVLIIVKASVVNKSHTVLDRTDEQSKQEGSWTVGKSNERPNLNPTLV
jgi:hypothetical protein